MTLKAQEKVSERIVTNWESKNARRERERKDGDDVLRVPEARLGLGEVPDVRVARLDVVLSANYLS